MHPNAALNRNITQITQVSPLFDEVNQRLFERLELIRITPSCILDIGSALGASTTALQQRYPNAHVVSLDIAEARCVENPNSLCLCANMQHLPFAANSFDFIYANLSFYWSVDTTALLEEIRRVLKPNGLLLFSTLGQDTLKELRLCWSMLDNHQHTLAFMDMHTIGDQLLAAKFQDPVADMETITITYQNCAALYQELKASGETNQHAQRPRGLMSRQRWQTLQKTYESQFATTDKRIMVTAEIVYGHGWKPEPKPHQAFDKQGVATFPAQNIPIKKKNSDGNPSI